VKDGKLRLGEREGGSEVGRMLGKPRRGRARLREVCKGEVRGVRPD
jgi:hypothetical protein